MKVELFTLSELKVRFLELSSMNGTKSISLEPSKLSSNGGISIGDSFFFSFSLDPSLVAVESFANCNFNS